MCELQKLHLLKCMNELMNSWTDGRTDRHTAIYLQIEHDKFIDKNKLKQINDHFFGKISIYLTLNNYM